MTEDRPGQLGDGGWENSNGISKFLLGWGRDGDGGRKRHWKGLTYQDIATIADKRTLIEMAADGKDWTRES